VATAAVNILFVDMPPVDVGETMMGWVAAKKKAP
jgi:hypothetical protein